MEKKDRQLLIKDLSARLPYGVRIREYNDEYGWHDGVLSTITNDYFSKGEPSIEGDCINRVEDVKPYLRPMSSMTEEEKSYFHNFKYWILKGDVEHCTINMVCHYTFTNHD